MIRYGLCRVCGAVARHKCSLCGKMVCRRHYDKAHRTCTECMSGRKISVT
ncbi:MAG: hypothetical protein ACREBH_02220 [Candidatus Micrarchaeaceae archaeon]